MIFSKTQAPNALSWEDWKWNEKDGEMWVKPPVGEPFFSREKKQLKCILMQILVYFYIFLYVFFLYEEFNKNIIGDFKAVNYSNLESLFAKY